MKKLLPLLIAAILILCSACSHDAIQSIGATRVVMVDPASSSTSNTEDAQTGQSSDETSTSSISVSQEITDDKAKQLIEEWLIEHPFGMELTVEPVWYAGGVRGGKDEGYFWYEVVNNGDPIIHIYVDQSNGELLLADREGLVPLDPWYQEVWLAQEAENKNDYYDELPELGNGLEWVEAPNLETVDKFGVKMKAIVGIIRNTTGKPITILIDFNTYDSAGNQIGTIYDIINGLGGGNTWKFEALINDQNIYSWEFAGIKIQ